MFEEISSMEPYALRGQDLTFLKPPIRTRGNESLREGPFSLLQFFHGWVKIHFIMYGFEKRFVTDSDIPTLVPNIQWPQLACWNLAVDLVLSLSWPTRNLTPWLQNLILEYVTAFEITVDYGGCLCSWRNSRALSCYYS